MSISHDNRAFTPTGYNFGPTFSQSQVDWALLLTDSRVRSPVVSAKRPRCIITALLLISGIESNPGPGPDVVIDLTCSDDDFVDDFRPQSTLRPIKQESSESLADAPSSSTTLPVRSLVDAPLADAPSSSTTLSVRSLVDAPLADLTPLPLQPSADAPLFSFTPSPPATAHRHNTASLTPIPLQASADAPLSTVSTSPVSPLSDAPSTSRSAWSPFSDAPRRRGHRRSRSSPPEQPPAKRSNLRRRSTSVSPTPDEVQFISGHPVYKHGTIQIMSEAAKLLLVSRDQQSIPENRICRSRPERIPTSPDSPAAVCFLVDNTGMVEKDMTVDGFGAWSSKTSRSKVDTYYYRNTGAWEQFGRRNAPPADGIWEACIKKTSCVNAATSGDAESGGALFRKHVYVVLDKNKKMIGPYAIISYFWTSGAPYSFVIPSHQNT
uniref:Uncharacterized protein n=1 Tax=Plectus sambesii TaxID=2011161 RepID=A0A914WNT1_9BILA